MNTNRKFPMNRIPIFMDERLFKMWENLGRDYIQTWANQTIILYSIDRLKTNVDDLYGESATPEDIRYLTPVELNCTYKIDHSANYAYVSENKSARYKQSGGITVNIYDSELEENKIDIKYGDIIGVVIDEKTIFYYEVVDEGKKNIDNQSTLYGYKRFWRQIKGAEIDENIFQG